MANDEKLMVILSSIRLPKTLDHRLDAVAEKLAMSKHDVIRQALLRGMPIMESDAATLHAPGALNT